MPPLRVHPANPRYFQDGDGRAVYLAGSHHWDSLVDNGERPGGFDFEGYLDSLAAWGHNFIRLWAHEAWLSDLDPRPWLRTGPGLALDGRPRFDLTRFDPEYFARLRWRVLRGAERGLYVAVMLFNGWSIHSKGEGNPWDHHPFNRLNNVNGADGDPDGRGDGADAHTLRVPAVTRLQELYVRQAVEAVGDLDNVLWEIGGDRAWVWKTFLRGHHVLYMDPLDADPVREEARRAMGDTVRYSRRLNLAACWPRINMSSSGYALANKRPGEVLTWLPRGRGWLRLGWLPGPLELEWFDPVNGRTVDGGWREGGAIRWLSAPWRGEAVALLRRRL